MTRAYAWFAGVFLILQGTSTLAFRLYGLFYIGLAMLGIITGSMLGLGLQPFDHPFHILLGGMGIAAAWFERRRGRTNRRDR